MESSNASPHTVKFDLQAGAVCILIGVETEWRFDHLPLPSPPEDIQKKVPAWIADSLREIANANNLMENTKKSTAEQMIKLSRLEEQAVKKEVAALEKWPALRLCKSRFDALASKCSAIEQGPALSIGARQKTGSGEGIGMASLTYGEVHSPVLFWTLLMDVLTHVAPRIPRDGSATFADVG